MGHVYEHLSGTRHCVKSKMQNKLTAQFLCMKSSEPRKKKDMIVKLDI